MSGGLSVNDGNAARIAGNTISGPMSCSRNTEFPSNGGVPNRVSGPGVGQCTNV